MHENVRKASYRPEVRPFVLKVMQRLNDKCASGRQLRTSATLYMALRWNPPHTNFPNVFKKRFGIIPGVTDKNYITNSYHVHVTEEIDAFSKLKFESEFQKLSPGGAISYVEVPNMQNNLDAVLSVMQYIYDNIM